MENSKHYSYPVGISPLTKFLCLSITELPTHTADEKAFVYSKIKLNLKSGPHLMLLIYWCKRDKGHFPSNTPLSIPG